MKTLYTILGVGTSLYHEDFVAEHHRGDEIPHGRGTGIVATGTFPLVGDETVALDLAAKLKIEQPRPLDGGHRPFGRPRTTCPRRKLPLKNPLQAWTDAVHVQPPPFQNPTGPES
jgi:hypothetical protein